MFEILSNVSREQGVCKKVGIFMCVSQGRIGLLQESGGYGGHEDQDVLAKEIGEFRETSQVGHIFS
jgi:hypothetical protein